MRRIGAAQQTSAEQMGRPYMGSGSTISKSWRQRPSAAVSERTEFRRRRSERGAQDSIGLYRADVRAAIEALVSEYVYCCRR